MKEQQLSPSSCRLRLHGIRFFYLHVLGWGSVRLVLHYPKKEQRIPELLTHAEVNTLLNQPTNFKHQTMLKVCYGTGLRVSELVGLRVRDIDGERQLLRIEQGKGRKDRLVPVPPSLMTLLREFWFAIDPPMSCFIPTRITISR
jgi:integrase